MVGTSSAIHFLQPFDKRINLMRSFLAIALFLGSAMTVAADTFVYVSMAPEQKIQIYRLDAKTGELAAVDSIAVDGAPGSLAVDPSKKFLFASLRSTTKLASFRIDAASGKLSPLSTAPLPKDENAAFVGTDRTGRWLISVSYAAGKTVVHRIGDDGKIETPAVQTVTTVKTAHSFATDPENRWVFVPHVTPNGVYQYRFDVKTGKLTDAPMARALLAKAGPRHIAWHPTQSLAFTSDEESQSITSYRYDAEKGLKALQEMSTLPRDFQGKNTCAEVMVHPSGKFVWVSNRGHDSLAGFSIDKTGKLSALGQTPTEKTPRSFAIEPNGRFLLAAGEGTGKLAVYSIDLDNGKLARVHTYDVGKSLTWVMTVQFASK